MGRFMESGEYCGEAKLALVNLGDALSDAAGVTMSRYRGEPASRSGDQLADPVSGKW